MKLYHASTLLGTITRSEANGFEMVGLIELTKDSEKFKELFAYICDEKRDKKKEPPFPKDMLENWFVQKDGGEKEEIGLPGVYQEGDETEIRWRYY